MHSSLKLLQTLITKGYRDPGQLATYLELRRALEGCESVLDVGCGTSSILQHLGLKRLVGLEGHEPSAQKARDAKTHESIQQGDARRLEDYFKPGEFDACVALDVIEHLPKEDGFLMMKSMEQTGAARIIFLTPNGFLPQDSIEDKDLQEHISGWEAKEMEDLGYNVTGILGPKSLRGEYHMLIKKPKVFWGIISLLGHLFCTRKKPEKAAAILCVKEKIRA